MIETYKILDGSYENMVTTPNIPILLESGTRGIH